MTLNWATDSCTLPTAERPLREAEFDALFAEAVRGVERRTPTVLRWRLDPVAEDRVRDLVARETSCCSFFRFDVRPGAGLLVVDVAVPEQYVPVLDALAARSASLS